MRTVVRLAFCDEGCKYYVKKVFIFREVLEKCKNRNKQIVNNRYSNLYRTAT